MITLEQILCRCTDEQLESLMSSAQAIMQHFEYVSGHSATYLAGETRAGQAQARPRSYRLRKARFGGLFPDGRAYLQHHRQLGLWRDLHLGILFDYFHLGVPP